MLILSPRYSNLLVDTSANMRGTQREVTPAQTTDALAATPTHLADFILGRLHVKQLHARGTGSARLRAGYRRLWLHRQEVCEPHRHPGRCFFPSSGSPSRRGLQFPEGKAVSPGQDREDEGGGSQPQWQQGLSMTSMASMP